MSNEKILPILKSIGDALISLNSGRKINIDVEDKTITAYKMFLNGREITRIDIKEA